MLKLKNHLRPNRYLCDYAKGRDNNFNLLRFSAATLVLITHSFVLSTGNPDSEPLRSSLGMTLGGIAVDVFFVTSGFLVTKSLLTRRSLRDFVVARALRIYPALWVAVALTVLVVGMFFSTTNFGTYIADIETWRYVFRNGLLFRSSVDTLPGAFTDVPWRTAVNGSLWTLPIEIKMYAVLAGLWILGKLFKVNQVRFVSVSCVILAVVGLGSTVTLLLHMASNSLVTLLCMFFTGAALHVLQRMVPLSSFLALMTTIGLISAAIIGELPLAIIYRLAIPYLVLYIAFVPGGFIRSFNLLGDYSYGIYIYAFPVQQALVNIWPGIDPYRLMAASFVTTIILAMFSWHLIESSALSLKGRFIETRLLTSHASA